METPHASDALSIARKVQQTPPVVEQRITEAIVAAAQAGQLQVVIEPVGDWQATKKALQHYGYTAELVQTGYNEQGLKIKWDQPMQLL